MDIEIVVEDYIDYLYEKYRKEDILDLNSKDKNTTAERPHISKQKNTTAEYSHIVKLNKY